jgi:hypothetical protein
MVGLEVMERILPSSKAAKLVDKFKKSVHGENNSNEEHYHACVAAIDCVDEILPLLADDTALQISSDYASLHPKYQAYWKEVRQILQDLRNQLKEVAY